MSDRLEKAKQELWLRIREAGALPLGMLKLALQEFEAAARAEGWEEAMERASEIVLDRTGMSHGLVEAIRALAKEERK